VPSVAVFVVPWCRALHVCCSDKFWITLRWFQLPVLLQM